MDREGGDVARMRIRELFGQQSYTAEEKAEIERYSAAVLGKGVRRCDCQDRYRDAVAEMYSVLKRNRQPLSDNNFNNDVMAQEKLYYMRKGVVIEWAHKYYTHINMTDEVARAYLAAHPKGVRYFEVVPASPAPKGGKKGGEPGPAAPEE